MNTLIAAASKVSDRALFTIVAAFYIIGGVGLAVMAGMAVSEELQDLALIDIYLAIIFGLAAALVLEHRRRLP